MSSNTIGSLGDNFASAMLTALTGSRPQISKDTISVDEQKQFLMQNIKHLELPDYKNIAKIITSNGEKKLLKDGAEGILVNLDTLSEQTVKQIYELVIYIMNNS